jgi:hypothetical protein
LGFEFWVLGLAFDECLVGRDRHPLAAIGRNAELKTQNSKPETQNALVYFTAAQTR